MYNKILFPHIYETPQEKRKRYKKVENTRVSQWLEDYVLQLKMKLGQEIADNYRQYIRARGALREDDKYVQAQLNFIYDCLIKLKTQNDSKNEILFNSLKRKVVDTLSIQHNNEKRKFIELKFE